MKIEKLNKITLVQGDCMQYMSQLPDNAYDLAIVDPPYGNLGLDRKTYFRHGSMTQYPKGKRWDVKPERRYFDELQRVSKYQLIFGANYFTNLIDLDGWSWLVWNKEQAENINNFAMGELAVYSGKKPLKIFNYSFLKNKNSSVNPLKAQNVKWHPCQKPAQLYRLILKMYAKEGDKILDTHLGSGTAAIAAHDGKFDFTGIEIDADYYENAKKNLQWHQKQMKLF